MPVFRESQYIKHAQYGFGVITESNAERTTIDFEIHGKKKFVTSLMVAELVGEAPPPKPPRPRRRKKEPSAVSAPAEAAAGPK